MKLLIFTVLASGVLASGAQLDTHDIENPVARAVVDPKTVDATKLSVLSVLKIAVPSGEVPFPTGGAEPEWFKNIPADVKSLLPMLYPALTPSPSTIMSSASASSNTTSTPTCITSTITKTLQYVSTGTAFANATSPTNGTLVSATPSPTGPISPGVRIALKMETLAALAWVGVGAGFFLFA